METIVCPTCKSENPAEAKFCMSCGESFLITPESPRDKTTLRLAPEPPLALLDKGTKKIKPEPQMQERFTAPLPDGEADSEAMPDSDKVSEQPHLEDIQEAAKSDAAPQTPRLFCFNCGREVKPGSKFCDKCGTRFEAEHGGGSTPPSPPKIKPETPPPAEPPARPPRRRRKTGCIILIILLCLLAVAAAVTGVVYIDEIKAMLGLTAATPVARIEAGIGRPSATPRPPDTETPIPTQTFTPTPTLTPTQTLPPTATPLPPRTLTICMGDEPDTLYPYGGSMLAMSNILDAIYDGPIDSRGYAYQPIILEKLPSLADGDAVLEAVTVQGGTLVVDNSGQPTLLSSGTWVRPSGCRAADCAIEFSGGSIQMDQLTATFHLLPGLRWSDGESLNAADSVYSFNLAADPDTPVSKYVIDRTATYQATDDLTTVWTGLPGYLDTTYFLNFWTPYPEHLWGHYSAADLITEVDERGLWLGWGAYMIDEWVFGDHITLSRNPNYFRSEEGLPNFTTLEYRFTGTDSSTNIASILSGECDIVNQTANLSDQSAMLLDLEAAGQVNAEIVPSTTWEHADFNIQPVASYLNSGSFAGWDTDHNGVGPFGDVRLRQAIAMCMDRQAVVDTVLYGQSIVLDTYIPPEHPLYNPQNTSWPYDPVAAGSLLDEIGWLDADGNPSTPRLARNIPGVPNGTPLRFAYETTTATLRQQATQILAESAVICGIQIELSYYPSGEWFADGPEGRLFGRAYDLGQFAWLTGIEPACDLFTTSNIPGDPNALDAQGNLIFPYGWGGQNNTGYSNPVYDIVCNNALGSLPGEDEYIESHMQAQRILSEDLPTIPLFLRLIVAASRPDMCGFQVDSTNKSEMWNIEAFDYGESCP